MLNKLFKRSRPAAEDGPVLVLDAGTTGVKAFVFSREEKVLGKAQEYIFLNRKQPGLAEQDAKEIADVSVKAIKDAVNKSGIKPEEITAFGITNQRESIVAWSRSSGQPLHPVIVWADTRSANHCARWRHEHGDTIQHLTGLPVEAYFSASKIHWLLDHSPEVVKAHKANDLAVGTIDSWLLWNLIEGSPHITDYTNAARTLLFNIHSIEWDQKLLDIFEVPRSILPEVKPSRSLFGGLRQDILGSTIPVRAVCGDQQASMFAAGTKAGTTKITYGTGTFIMQSQGNSFSMRRPFYTTIIPGSAENEYFYALEAKISRGGREVEPLLNDKVRLEQFLRDLAVDVDHYIDQFPLRPEELIIDGGVARDKYLPTLQKEVSNLPVRRQPVFDGTSLGIARLIRSG